VVFSRVTEFFLAFTASQSPSSVAIIYHLLVHILLSEFHTKQKLGEETNM